MSYKITITRLEPTTQTESNYQKIREPYPDEEQRFAKREEREVDPQYGYVKVQVLRTKETEVLSQEVDEIDLKVVIKAINGLA